MEEVVRLLIAISVSLFLRSNEYIGRKQAADFFFFYDFFPRSVALIFSEATGKVKFEDLQLTLFTGAFLGNFLNWDRIGICRFSETFSFHLSS